jgi:diadenosine tetraphosphate (Ap4A) HIT family hydrolase
MDNLTRKLSIFFSPKCHKMLVNTNEGSASGASIPTHHHRHVIIMMTVPSNFTQAVQQAPKWINLTAISQGLQSIFKTTLPTVEHSFLHQISVYHPHCYLCSLAKNTCFKNDKKNLVVYRGRETLVMLAHRPTYFGQLDVIPLKHYDAPGAMDKVTYYEINMVTRVFQRIIGKLVNAQGCNVGYSCSTTDTSDTNHFCQHIIPRKESWVSSPIIGPIISGDVKDLYGKLKNWGQLAKM